MTSRLLVYAWWRDVAERAFHNALQVVVPVLALGTAGDLAGVDPLDIVLTVGLSTVVVVGKAVAGLSGGSWLERAAGAAAGSALALLPVKALDLVGYDWRTFAVAVASSALLAVTKSLVAQPQDLPVVAAAVGTDLRPPV
jgi:hypothetical protein